MMTVVLSIDQIRDACREYIERRVRAAPSPGEPIVEAWPTVRVGIYTVHLDSSGESPGTSEPIIAKAEITQ